LKKTSEDGKISYAYGTCRINILKMTILPKASNVFNTFPIKIPMAFFSEVQKSNIKYIWKLKRPRITKAVLKNNFQCWRYLNTQLQTMLQGHNNKTSMVLAQKQT
jgi:hypothetical protein